MQNSQAKKIDVQERESGKIIAVAGASQSGKSSQVKTDISTHERVAVWDVRGEYPNAKYALNMRKVTTRRELIDALSDDQPCRVAYMPTFSQSIADEFDFFCRAAYAWIKYWPATIVCDELADVTNPGKAPPAWGELLRKGKYYGAFIYGISQSPQESDKTIWRNADVWRCLRVEGEDALIYMAKRMAISADKIPTVNLEFVQRLAGIPEPTTHKVQFLPR